MYLTIEQAGQAFEVFWPGIFGLGLLIGTITGLFGVGGGFLLTPALRIFFGIPYDIAVGSNLLQVFVNGSVSSFKHYRRGNVDLKLGCTMAVAALGGGYIGKTFLDLLNERAGMVMINGHEHKVLDLVMAGLFVASMLAVMIHMLRTRKTATDDQVSTRASRWVQSIELPPVLAYPRAGIEKLTIWMPLAISFFVGILTGLLGIGGFVMFPLLVFVLGVTTSVAVGTSALQLVFAAGFSTIFYIIDDKVSFALVGLLLSGSMIGVQIGVHICEKLGGAKIRRYFTLILAAGILMILISTTVSLLNGPPKGGVPVSSAPAADPDASPVTSETGAAEQAGLSGPLAVPEPSSSSRSAHDE